MVSTSLLVTDKVGKGVTLNLDHLSDGENIPELTRKYKTMLRFPEKLMLLMTFVERTVIKQGKKPEDACISWSSEGKVLIIRNDDELVRSILPCVVHSKITFASFTRKLYRWGFRRHDAKASKGRSSTTSGKCFVHEHFQRDDKTLMTKMNSTATQKSFPTDPTLQNFELSTWRIPQTNRLTEQQQNLESLQVQLRRASAVAEMHLSSFNAPFPFSCFDGNTFPDTYVGGTESDAVQRAVEQELKQKQAKVLGRALQLLMELAEHKKQVAVVQWG